MIDRVNLSRENNTLDMALSQFRTLSQSEFVTQEKLWNLFSVVLLCFEMIHTLTRPVPNLLAPTPDTKVGGGGGRPEPPAISKPLVL